MNAKVRRAELPQPRALTPEEEEVLIYMIEQGYVGRRGGGVYQPKQRAKLVEALATRGVVTRIFKVVPRGRQDEVAAARKVKKAAKRQGYTVGLAGLSLWHEWCEFGTRASGQSIGPATLAALRMRLIQWHRHEARGEVSDYDKLTRVFHNTKNIASLVKP